MAAQGNNWAGALRNTAIMSAGLPLVVLAMLAMIVLPMPPLVLDALFTFNICISLVVILAVVYVMRPLDLAAFPTVLLLATLLRLALNVASTRVVLLNGHTGGDSAGKVIEAFGDFVIGGNYAVGIVVFAILLIINFMVVTKGAGRVSEVSARFTLDSMPGKQMAIDADLNAGIITQAEAVARRSEVRMEADFYGSMDGASKFVRGDAIAGLLIVFINLIGGILIGVLQHDMSFCQAASTYALLTIGDGLVAQIPSLLLAISVAVIVTRMSRSEDMGKQMFRQLLGDRRVLRVVAVLLGLLGIVPGMPNVAFLLMAGVCAGGAWLLDRRDNQAEVEAETPRHAGRGRQRGQSRTVLARRRRSRCHRPRCRLPADSAGRPPAGRRTDAPDQGRAQAPVRGSGLSGFTGAHPRRPGPAGQRLSHQRDGLAGRHR